MSVASMIVPVGQRRPRILAALFREPHAPGEVRRDLWLRLIRQWTVPNQAAIRHHAIFRRISASTVTVRGSLR